MGFKYEKAAGRCRGGRAEWSKYEMEEKKRKRHYCKSKERRKRRFLVWLLHRRRVLERIREGNKEKENERNREREKQKLVLAIIELGK